MFDYSLTEAAFRTVNYERISNAQSVLEDLGLYFLLYDKQTRLINGNSEQRAKRMNSLNSAHVFIDSPVYLLILPCYIIHTMKF